MTKFPFMQVDAFTTQALGGNPCAVVFDADALDDAKMLAIAKEMNLSETAFIMASDKADFRFRFFTPSEEIPLAGHPTIASVFALIEAGRIQPESEHTTISLELTAGVIQVEIVMDGDSVQQIVMRQLKPQFMAHLPAEEVMPAFNLTPADVLPDAPIQIVSTGAMQLMIPIANLDALRRSRLDFVTYAALKDKYPFFSPHLFCIEGITETGQTFARHFGLPPDTIEDPFTGSATGGMAAYLWKHGLIDSPKFVAEQGHWMDRPGVAQVEVVGPRENIEAVKVGGQAVVIIVGELIL